MSAGSIAGGNFHRKLALEDGWRFDDGTMTHVAKRRCPVCNGAGRYQTYNYQLKSVSAQCRACYGEGQFGCEITIPVPENLK